mmetsp:Transcript_69150/g.184270  ORF Transcript_69150/g.184270 Transcript_69150/m.184270 type:complete len:183 (-) Transcript_69150:309-857(-)
MAARVGPKIAQAGSAATRGRFLFPALIHARQTAVGRARANLASAHATRAFSGMTARLRHVPGANALTTTRCTSFHVRTAVVTAIVWPTARASARSDGEARRVILFTVREAVLGTAAASLVDDVNVTGSGFCLSINSSLDSEDHQILNALDNALTLHLDAAAFTEPIVSSLGVRIIALFGPTT